MKNGPKRNTQFHGILTIGATLEEAKNRYRLLAMGKGVSAKLDESRSLAFITTAGSGMPELFNPLTGELNLRSSKKFLAGLNFEAKAGDADVTTNHYQCTASCGQHIVYDSESLLKFCPVCTTAVAGTTSESGDEEDDHAIIDQQSDEAEEDADDQDDEDDADDEELDDDIDNDPDLDPDDEDDLADDLSLGDEDDSDDDEDDTSESSDDEDEEDEEDDDSDDEEDEEDDESESSTSAADEPLLIAANTKDEAVSIYQEQRRNSSMSSADVHYLVCSASACGAHVISDQAGVTACPNTGCGAPLVEPTQADSGSAGEEESSGIVRVPAATAGDDEDEDDDDDLAVVDEDDEDEDDEDDESESSAATGTPAVARRVKKPAKPAVATAADGATVEAPVVAAPLVQPPVDVPPTEQVDVDMLAKIDDSAADAHKALDLSFSSAIGGKPQWTAFFNGTPVATARVEDAGTNADMFTEARFGHAVIASAKHAGVKTVLREMGFKPVVCSVNIPLMVKDRVAEQVAVASTALDAEQSVFTERFMAAMATAAVGINRGFFAGLKNPIKAKLWDALSAAGIQNAEVLLDSAFRAASDEYHKVLFAQASDIVAKPQDVQESLSKAVLGMSYMAATAGASHADSSSFEDRLANFGTPAVASSAQTVAVPAKAVASQAPTADAHVSNVVASLGRRR